MPERSRRFYDAMVLHGWLTGYQDGEVVDAVLKAMSRRRPTAGPVGEGWKAFVAHECPLKECARVLIADMNAWAKDLDLVSLVHRPIG
jgi:acyl carrier protein phosphodiesterase